MSSISFSMYSIQQRIKAHGNKVHRVVQQQSRIVVHIKVEIMIKILKQSLQYIVGKNLWFDRQKQFGIASLFSLNVRVDFAIEKQVLFLSLQTFF